LAALASPIFLCQAKKLRQGKQRHFRFRPETVQAQIRIVLEGLVVPAPAIKLKARVPTGKAGFVFFTIVLCDRHSK